MVRSVGGTQEVSGGPVLVHCSAGLGRTGVFLAVHRGLETHEIQRRVDVGNIVREMREQRQGMVQTLDQFRFCFEALAEALDPLSTERDTRTTSEPASMQNTTRREQRQRYSRDTISTPLPPAPLATEGEDDLRDTTASPPPPTSSPPPPLTPRHPSTETTPTKFPLPPSSAETTPTQEEAFMQPTIIVIPPTRHASQTSINESPEPSDEQLVRRKLESLREMKQGGGGGGGGGGGRGEDRGGRRDDGEGGRGAERVETREGRRGDRESGKRFQEQKETKRPISQSKVGQAPKKEKTSATTSRRESSLQGGGGGGGGGGRGKEERDLLHREKPSSVTGSLMKEDDLDSTFNRFELPPPEEEEEEDGGFEIGDDQVLKAGPPPKMEKKTADVERGQVKRPKWRPPPPATSATLQSVGDPKPQKWGQPLFHSTTPPAPPVNRTQSEREQEDRREVRSVGKLKIPGIFSADAVSPRASPERKPFIPAPEDVKPVPKPIEPVPKPVRPDTPQPVGKVSLPKWAGASTTGKTLPASSYPWKRPDTTPPEPHPPSPPPAQVGGAAVEGGGDTPPVMRLIRQMEGQRTSHTHPSAGKQPVKPVRPESKPAKPATPEPTQPLGQEASKPVTQEPPKLAKPEKQEPSAPATSVAKLLAQFEGKR